MDAKVRFLLCLALCAFHWLQVEGRKKLIVVLIDGVRWDYIDDPNLKGFPRMIKNGVRASYVYPVYPSVSYPNWYTIVTGLYTENHGFVENQMYDPKLQSFFYPNDTDLTGLGSAWWNEAQPVWIGAEKNGSKAAMYWWSGCEIEIQGKHPMICERHRYGPGTDDEKYDFFNRIEDLVGLFNPKRLPEDTSRGLALALMYYGPLDYNGHKYGPDSKEVKKSLYSIDEVLDKMQSKLKKAGLEDEVNIMVVSDHGMTSLKDTKYVDLDKFAASIKYQVTAGTDSMIIPEEGMLEKLYNEMKQDNIKGVRVLKREQIPDSYHLKGNERVTPLYLQAEQGFYIKAITDDKKRIGKPYKVTKGTHGYDPDVVQDMRTIFVASGPDFRKGYKSPVLHNVDFYNVMCHILGMDPLPNNGSWDRVSTMLVEDHPAPFVKAKASSLGGYCRLIVISCLVIIAFNFC